MSARNSAASKARRRAERTATPHAPSETRIGVCRGCDTYTELHAESGLCKSCFVDETERESQACWAAEVADMARHKIVV